jgi:hypothetical protein
VLHGLADLGTHVGQLSPQWEAVAARRPRRRGVRRGGRAARPACAQGLDGGLGLADLAVDGCQFGPLLFAPLLGIGAVVGHVALEQISVLVDLRRGDDGLVELLGGQPVGRGRWRCRGAAGKADAISPLAVAVRALARRLGSGRIQAGRSGRDTRCRGRGLCSGRGGCVARSARPCAPGGSRPWGAVAVLVEPAGDGSGAEAMAGVAVEDPCRPGDLDRVGCQEVVGWLCWP